MSIIKRGSTLYLRKRVPRRYMTIEAREFVLISLHTDSMEVAKLKEGRMGRPDRGMGGPVRRS